MSIEISKIGNLYVAVEGSFCEDDSGAVENFVHVPVTEGTTQLTITQDHLEPNVMQQFVHAHTDSLMVLAKKSSTLNFSTLLAGTGAPQDGNNTWLTTTTWYQARLLGSLMGGVSQGTPQVAATLTTATGSTAVLTNVTVGHGNTLGRAGGAYAVLMPNGLFEAREILSVTANTVTPKQAFSTSPGIGATVLWATTFHMVEGLASFLNSLQFLVVGAEATDEYAALGCQGTFGIDVSLGALPTLSVQMTGASWVRPTVLTMAPATYVGFAPIAYMSGELIIGSGTITGVQTRNLVLHSGSTWQPGYTNTLVTDPSGPSQSGAIGWKRQRSVAVTGAFTTYDDSLLNWITQDANRANLSISQQIGNTLAGGMVLLTAPTVQISAVPTRGNTNDIYTQNVTWKARNDAAIASPTTDLQRSAFRVHIF